MSAAAAPTPTMLTIPTRLFGPVQVPSDRLLTFPDGLPGFAGERRFALLETGGEGLAWLQGAEDSGLAFLLVDPFRAFPGLELELGLPAGSEAPMVYAVVTLPARAGEPCTANLQAPVLLDVAARAGRQVVLADPRHSHQAPFDLAALLPGRSSPGPRGR